jgi:hypothetical protein
MKLKITEQQLHSINEFLAEKKAFFKYWDRFGGKIDDNFYKLFGFEGTRVPELIVGKTKIKYYDVLGFLREWLGESKSIKLTEELLKGTHHVVGDPFGGYDYTFTVSEIQEKDSSQFTTTVLIDDVNGEVSLVMTVGETLKLIDARNNEDIGWEIENEIQDCTDEYLSREVTSRTGIVIVFNDIDFTSGEK